MLRAINFFDKGYWKCHDIVVLNYVLTAGLKMYIKIKRSVTFQHQKYHFLSVNIQNRSLRRKYQKTFCSMIIQTKLWKNRTFDNDDSDSFRIIQKL